MPAKFKDLKKFCEKDGWELYKSTDHWFYRKVLPDGDILLTKVSHSVHKEIHSNRLWNDILKRQLRVSESEFWSIVKK